MGFLDSLFGSGIGSPTYDAAKGLPGFQAGSNPGQLQNAQTQTQGGINQQQNFLNALNQNNGLMGGQVGVYNAYTNLAQGQGPNPGQAQLAQNTGRNVAQQAAMAGSVRGGQSNPGLVARQAGQVGAGVQQQAVGQAATMGAQQQLGALGQMGNLATQGVGQQQTALNQLGSQNLQYQQMLQQALTAQNQQQVMAQAANVPLQQQGMKTGAGIFGGLANAVGGLGGSLLGGGAAGGGATATASELGAGMGGAGAEGGGGAAGAAIGLLNQGGTVSPSPWAHMSGGRKNMKTGGFVPGKAKVAGDSPKNDTVKANVSPGEVVIKRSAAKDPHAAAAFLNNLMGWNLRAH